MQDDPVGLIEWIGTITASLLGLAFGNIYMKTSRLEERVGLAEEKARVAAMAGDDKLWAEVRVMSANNQVFRENILSNMVTKSDLHDMEKRLEVALRSRAA